MTDSTELTDSAELAERLPRLHARLEREAAAAGLLDVAYRLLDSPVGQLLLARTPAGLVRVAFPADHEHVLTTLAERISPRILLSPKALDEMAAELDAYFAGRRTAFSVPLDRQLSHGFLGQVQHALSDIPFGTTVSYGQLADRAGNPRAVRAVGTACATNPLPIVVPCHRVLRSDGTLGGYVGGIDAKRLLLDLERA
ncbi:methylated-DNA--[protein]-cysteine S-methyltransferase [Nostocoides jenkinsii]|uniref:Methylated-DNA--protein-cysteine methyltransferase n=1 Tax=Nostocoides jenkinsii Ben 74 TaxID=1193518 RepID=A0A077M9N6_9MICO|nr:methylated-DNA--[protein]-cysteine S-methyltransferase [Tetrasphaera jenkinsii]CCI51507.1 Methylated-DNA--protein-cysteine methyltransferase [Tetrasphaera jenkinsii Ben 74]